MTQGKCNVCRTAWSWPKNTSRRVYCPQCGARLCQTRSATAIKLDAPPTGKNWAELHARFPREEVKA